MRNSRRFDLQGNVEVSPSFFYPRTQDFNNANLSYNYYVYIKTHDSEFEANKKQAIYNEQVHEFLHIALL